MNKNPLLSIACASLLLLGCDHYSTQLTSLPSVSPAAGGDKTFGQYMMNEYSHMARYENDEKYDYKAAKYYMAKADKLSKGQMVSPAALTDFDIAPSQKQELGRAREELVSALTTYNIPENRYALAMAHTRYDCWIEQQAESSNAADAATCKNEFRYAMASLVPPDGRDVRFAVPFTAGSLNLSEEARVSLGRAISFWRNNETRGYQLSLKPASSVQQEESERQLSMVRSILQFNGVPASNINVMTLKPEGIDPINMFEIILKKDQNIQPEKSEADQIQPAI